jgi:hypothetical protein
VFYEDYIPRPRLVALNACASFLENTVFRRVCLLDRQTYAYFFGGPEPVCVLWHLDTTANVVLPLSENSILPFDLWGNGLRPLGGSGAKHLVLEAGQPVYLRARGDQAHGAGRTQTLENAVARARVSVAAPMSVTVRTIAGPRLEVVVTNNTRREQDGVVELLAPAGAAQPAPKHFDSLAAGASISFSFALPEGHGRGEVRVRCGDHEIWETKTPYQS